MLGDDAVASRRDGNARPSSQQCPPGISARLLRRGFPSPVRRCCQVMVRLLIPRMRSLRCVALRAGCGAAECVWRRALIGGEFVVGEVAGQVAVGVNPGAQAWA
jgi:hypothetical protein